MLKIVYHERCLTPYYTSVVESPLRVQAVYGKLKEHFEAVTPEPATAADILRVHNSGHLERVQQEGRETYQAALAAAGGALCAAKLAVGGVASFAIIRPPGHHAAAGRFGGFCFFNNMAVALAALFEAGAIRSAAIVDIDMHQGDGTASIFAERPEVSIIDIRARSREAYLERLRAELDELSDSDIVGISAGFDLYVRDWGALLETADFQTIGCAIASAASRKANGHCFALLEGGYYLSDLARNALAFCQGLAEGLAATHSSASITSRSF